MQEDKFLCQIDVIIPELEIMKSLSRHLALSSSDQETLFIIIHYYHYSLLYLKYPIYMFYNGNSLHSIFMHDLKEQMEVAVLLSLGREFHKMIRQKDKPRSS